MLTRSLIGLTLLIAPAQAQQSNPALEAPPQRIATEDFGKLASFDSPEISPDGKRVVATSVANGRTAVALFDLTRADYGLTRLDLPKDAHMLWARWAGPNKVLLGVAAPDTHYGHTFHTPRLLVHDAVTGRIDAIAPKLLVGTPASVVHVDPQARFLLLSATGYLQRNPSVWRVDLATLALKEVQKPNFDVGEWFADSAGQVRAGLGGGLHQWAMMYRPDGTGRFKRILSKPVGDSTRGLPIERLYPQVGSDSGYALGDNGSGRMGLYRFDFRTGAFGAPVFEHPQVDVEAVSQTPEGELAAVTYVEDRERTRWLDPAMQTLQGRIDRAFPGRIARIVSRDDANRTMIVRVGGASDPGAYYLFNRDKKEMRLFAAARPQLEGRRMAEVQSVRYPARDGLSIPAYLTLPAGREPRALPLIMLPHGGPFYRDRWEFDEWAQFLANRGYAVLQPNFRGSTGYGRAFTDAGSGQFGRKMQDDLDDGLRWLAERGIADPKRVCIMGASYGGYAAMWGAVRNPDLYRCAISFAGISDVTLILRSYRKGWVPTRYYHDFRERLEGESEQGLADVAPLARASKLRVPLLLAHGSKDPVVPVEQSERMHEALARFRIPHEYVIYKGERHSFQEEANSIDFLRRVEAFLARHNPA